MLGRVDGGHSVDVEDALRVALRLNVGDVDDAVRAGPDGDHNVVLNGHGQDRIAAVVDVLAWRDRPRRAEGGGPEALDDGDA